ncbi:unnamed protein product [Rotaria sordida]|uniref:Cathepsin propeptide inhibitor domain-containing protein n=1 Tax=Rotaria sordida TaxID=392033 RepID=A0A820EMQ2_9BILA|nr:unnamed protein product [Rotaria sordida]
MNSKEVIENNPGLVDYIYRYFQQTYPRQDTSRIIDFQKSKHMKIFKSNLKYVIRHNENPSTTFKLKINKFSDWTDEERDGLHSKLSVGSFNNVQPPESRDDTI